MLPPLRYRSGFALLEVVAVLGLIMVALPSMLTFSFKLISAIDEQVGRVEAAYLAEEGVEAVRSIRDRGWTSLITPLVSGTTYYLSVSNNTWTLTTVNPGLIDGLYERTVVVSEVNRDANDDITTSGGTVDVNTRHVLVTVSWSQGGVTRSIPLATYLTNFQQN